MARRNRNGNGAPRAKTLDRSKPFQSIHYATTPEDPKAPYFKQDGKLFGISGNLVGDDPAYRAAPEPEAPAPKAAATSRVRGYDQPAEPRAKPVPSPAPDSATRDALMKNFGITDPVDEQREAARENAAADAVEREHTE